VDQHQTAVARWLGSVFNALDSSHNQVRVRLPDRYALHHHFSTIMLYQTSSSQPWNFT
jgi:hypothetical protein